MTDTFRVSIQFLREEIGEQKPKSEWVQRSERDNIEIF